MSIRHALLGLLAQNPRHGYELRAAFEALVGGAEAWDVKPAQIYTTLDRLNEAGLVQLASDLGHGEEPSRRVYALTEAGRQALQEWFASVVDTRHQRDEFFVKLMVALFSGEGSPEHIIRIQRGHLYREMHTLTALRDGYDAQAGMAQILLLDKAIMHLEADLRWMDITEMRIEAIKGQSFPEPEIRPRGRPRKGEKGSTYPPPGQ
ncbi:MAG: PadR family transcriptional regulator [Anaerolineales bacterium]|jgi:DNA-binding PadR family transcriptional regulator|nr:PadR family transcriptional regulator [Anaerolineales bacterium]